MFSIKGKIVIVDFTNFTLGAVVTLVENGKAIKSFYEQDISKVKTVSLDFSKSEGVNNIFLIPLVGKENAEELKKSYEQIIATNYSEENIYIHLM